MYLENDTPLLHLNFSEKGNKKFIFANVTDICKTMHRQVSNQWYNFILDFLCSARTRYPFPFRRNGYYDRKCRVIRQINEMSKRCLPSLSRVGTGYVQQPLPLSTVYGATIWLMSCPGNGLSKNGLPLFGNDDSSRTTTEPDDKCAIYSVMYNEVYSGDNWFLRAKSVQVVLNKLFFSQFLTEKVNILKGYKVDVTISWQDSDVRPTLERRDAVSMEYWKSLVPSKAFANNSIRSWFRAWYLWLLMHMLVSHPDPLGIFIDMGYSKSVIIRNGWVRAYAHAPN